jgi:hypothetical protein
MELRCARFLTDAVMVNEQRRHSSESKTTGRNQESCPEEKQKIKTLDFTPSRR